MVLIFEGEVWINFLGHAVNTSMYAYQPLSMRLIFPKSSSKPPADLQKLKGSSLYNIPVQTGIQ